MVMTPAAGAGWRLVGRLWEEFERFSLRKDKSLAEAANDAIVKKARVSQSVSQGWAIGQKHGRAVAGGLTYARMRCLCVWVQEEVRSSSCTICFEEAPDTQTLCCGGKEGDHACLPACCHCSST